VLGIILTKLLEENYRRGILLKKSIPGLFGSIFTSPITFILFVLIVVMFTTQTQTYKNWKAKKDAEREIKKAA
jgi:putative tricarboxylic transport membrane protein